MSIANASADARGLRDGHDEHRCEGCGADWAADEDCADGCPGSEEACAVCHHPWPTWYPCGWRCSACAPLSTAASRMAAGEVA